MSSSKAHFQKSLSLIKIFQKLIGFQLFKTTENFMSIWKEIKDVM